MVHIFPDRPAGIGVVGVRRLLVEEPEDNTRGVIITERPEIASCSVIRHLCYLFQEIAACLFACATRFDAFPVMVGVVLFAFFRTGPARLDA